MPILTRTERWIISNQYRILEALYPREAEVLAERREAIDSGYELHYEEACQHIYDDDWIMAVDECREVIDILEMFSSIKRAYEVLPDKSGVEEHTTTFVGFDGNEETKQMSYARYFCESGDRFSDLDRGDNFNSHCPVLEPYRHMLAEWKRSTDKHKLTKEDLIRITSNWRYDP